MLKGGVIMDVVTPEHAKIAEDAGACAVMALERVPADIRADGGVARMSDPGLIEQIIFMQELILNHSMLMRLIKFYWGPMLKSIFIADFGNEAFPNRELRTVT